MDDYDELLDARERREAADAKVAAMFARREGSSRDWIEGAEQFLRPAARAMLYGPKESGKSWAALQLCQQVAAAGGRAVYTDLENGQLRMDERSKLLGGEWEGDAFQYTSQFRFRELHDADVMRSFAGWMEETDLWVIDSAARVLTELGLNETSNSDFAKFMGQFIDPICENGWTAVLLLDNVGYDTSHPRGASNKTDLVELAYRVEGGKTCTPARNGTIRLKRTRDRDGDAAEELTMSAGGGKYTTLGPATPDTRKADLHDEVVKLLADAGPVKSKREVAELLRERQVKVPRRSEFNGWMDDWAESSHSGITEGPEGWEA